MSTNTHVLRPLLALALLGAVTACGHVPTYRTVKVPVTAACIPKVLPPAPAGLETKESLAGVSDDTELLQRLYADWKVRVARMLETEPVIAACR